MENEFEKNMFFKSKKYFFQFQESWETKTYINQDVKQGNVQRNNPLNHLTKINKK